MSHPIEELIYRAQDPILVSRQRLAEEINAYGWGIAEHFQRVRRRKVQGRWSRRNRRRYEHTSVELTPTAC